MLRVSSIEGNSQRLDGGAMFGNAPRSLWQEWAQPDAEGRIPLACRCFLVEWGERKILLETGVGAFFPPRLRERYGVLEEEHVLLESLRARGISESDIDMVVLSHLHFDHAGGLLGKYEESHDPFLVFPKAEFVVGTEAWRRARSPHLRDRASFIAELPHLLVASGRLRLVEEDVQTLELTGDRITFVKSQGHTPGMLLSLLTGTCEKAIFCADLVPGAAWVHAPITMGYDRFPERLIDEKVALYERLGVGTWLLFTHDPVVAAGRLALDEKGRFCVGETRPTLDRFPLDS